jgi:hypothetical protein
MVGMFVCLCLVSNKPSEREFFVPAGTDLGVKLLNQIGLDATNRRFVILGTKHDKAQYPAKNEGQFLSSPKPIALRDAALIAPQI